MRIFFVLALCFITVISGFGQEKRSKALRKYDAYWAQKELEENYNKTTGEAHQLFQKKEYTAAITAYKKALTIKPNDPRSIAKITDIRILMASKDNPNLTKKEEAAIAAQVKKEAKQQAKEEAAAAKAAQKEEKKVEIQPEVKEVVTQEVAVVENTEESIVPLPNEVEEEPELPEPAPTTPEPTPTATEKPEQKPVNVAPQEKPKPINVEEFRTNLALEYKEGMTEKVIKEERKTTTIRVIVKGRRGDEYRKVVHNWGGVYFFKNGIAVAESIWNVETEKKP